MSRLTTRPAWRIAIWEMRGAARSRWVIAAAALYALLAVGVALVNLRSMSVLGLRGIGAAVDGIFAVGLLVPPLFGIVLGAGAVAGARDQGALAMIAAQPLRRGSIVWGVFLGMTATVWAAVGVGLGLVAVVTAPAMTGADLAGLGVAAATTLLAGAAGVALGTLVSTVASGRGQATAVAVAIWFLVALGIDVVLVALAPVSLGPVGLLAVTVANPLATIRTLGILVTEPANLGPLHFFLESRFGSALAVTLLGGVLVAWIWAPVAAASYAIRRRDI
jgi:Cu-processing system permease protein